MAFPGEVDDFDISLPIVLGIEDCGLKYNGAFELIALSLLISLANSAIVFGF